MLEYSGRGSEYVVHSDKTYAYEGFVEFKVRLDPNSTNIEIYANIWDSINQKGDGYVGTICADALGEDFYFWLMEHNSQSTS